MPKQLDTVVLCDFDGTAAAEDLGQIILRHFTGDAWLAVNEQWEREEITTTERVRLQYAPVRTTEEELAAVALSVGLDPHFGQFVGFCQERGWPVVVVSDGFDFYIRRMLEREGLGYLPWSANKLRFADGSLEFEFLSQNPECDLCGNCKKNVLESYRPLARRIVYVGDGLSDRCGAEAADLVFAKKKLLVYCREKGIPFHQFTTFGDVIEQLSIVSFLDSGIDQIEALAQDTPYRERLTALLGSDLDFHDQDSSYGSHNFHAFPAKFPPQLPLKFIMGLTQPGDIVLDPMMGSGTTVVEATMAGRRAVGFDIDPLAALVTRVKATPLSREKVAAAGKGIIEAATAAMHYGHGELTERLATWRTNDPDSMQFIDMWFDPRTQLELLALKTQIEAVEDQPIRAFFELVLSAIIVTKSGGVSLALDLAHTRPHKPKVVINRAGEVIYGKDTLESGEPNVAVLTKTLRSPLEEFDKRLRNNLRSLPQERPNRHSPDIRFGCSAEKMPLGDHTVDLIVTSPPYASNAIDYMRAHKFSLVWLGHRIADLSQKRKEYIGGEAVSDAALERLPASAAAIVAEIEIKDKTKARVLHLYYSEMTRVLREMFRVLRPGKSAILVVGSSSMRGIDTETQNCLAAIGRDIGFEVPLIGERNLDRDRRMLPAGMRINRGSQIQQRMHVEYVIGFYKP